jgi:hypothetical protein
MLMCSNSEAKLSGIEPLGHHPLLEAHVGHGAYGSKKATAIRLQAAVVATVVATWKLCSFARDLVPGGLWLRVFCAWHG